MLFDTHAHFDDERFESDRYQAIENAYKSGVTRIINAAADVESARASIALAHRYSFMYATVGVHPHSADTMDEKSIEILTGLAGDEKVVAIGEIGLDYYYDNSPRDCQRYWFARQIAMARELSLPIVVHNRDAHQDTMDIIKREKASEVGGVLHCFTGSVEMARELLNLNFYISLGGPVTFKNSKKAVEVAQYVSIDRLLIETDSPYLTPEPFRGRRNDSSLVRCVAEKIAEIKGMPFEKVAEATAENAKKLFGIE